MIRAALTRAARIVLLVLWGLVMAPQPALAALFTLGSRRARVRTGPFLHQLGSRGICRSLGIRVQWSGELPPVGSMVASNHMGYVDVFVLGSLYRTLFVSRADVARWPVLGLLARAGGTIFLERERRKDAARVGGSVAEHLLAGSRVTVFPEGGTSSGEHVLAFRSPLFQAAVSTGAPCVPVAIRYRLPRDPDAEPRTAVAWVDRTLPAHLWRLLALRRIEAEVRFLPARTGTDRKELAREVEEAVRAALA